MSIYNQLRTQYITDVKKTYWLARQIEVVITHTWGTKRSKSGLWTE